MHLWIPFFFAWPFSFRAMYKHAAYASNLPLTTVCDGMAIREVLYWPMLYSVMQAFSRWVGSPARRIISL